VAEKYRITLSTRRITIALATVAATLVALHIATWVVYLNTDVLDHQAHWASLFDLDTETGIGTWFSSAMLLAASGVTMVLAAARRSVGLRWSIGWWIIGVALMAASFDEVAAVHESLNSDPTIRLYIGHWTAAGAAFSIVFGILLMPFLWSLPDRTRWLLILSAVVYLAGALGVEYATLGYEREGNLNSLAYNLWNAPEEGLEMAGVIIYLYAVLDHMRGKGGRAPEASVEVRP